MKKRLIPILIALALCMSIVFCACGSTSETPICDYEELSAETRTKIAQAYCDLYQLDENEEKNFEVEEFYTSREGVYVFYTHYAVFAFLALRSEKIGGVRIEYPDSIGFNVYIEQTDEIIGLANAYEQGLVTKKDIKLINEKHKKARSYLYKD